MMKAQMPSTPVTGRFFFSLTVTILRLILSIVVSVVSVYSAGMPSVLGASRRARVDDQPVGDVAAGHDGPAGLQGQSPFHAGRVLVDDVGA